MVYVLHIVIVYRYYLSADPISYPVRNSRSATENFQFRLYMVYVLHIVLVYRYYLSANYISYTVRNSRSATKYSHSRLYIQ